MCWDEHHDDHVDALTKLVFWNPDRGDKQNMATTISVSMAETEKKTVQYCCTYIRVHRRSSTSTYPRKRYATKRGYMPSSRITSLPEGLEFTPPSSARTKGDDTRYYVYTYLVRIRVPIFSFWFSVWWDIPTSAFFHSRAYIPHFMIPGTRYVLCTRYVYTYVTYVMLQIRTYVPAVSYTHLTLPTKA